MAMFVFSAQQLTNVLREQIKRGVEIRLVADPSFASRSFSEALDLLGVTLPDHTCKVEADNQPLNQALQGVDTVTRPRRQAASQVRRDQQPQSDHGILQLVAFCRTHQR